MNSTLVKDTVAKIRELYEIHGAGGNCHIVTDDGNLEDSNIMFCLESEDLLDIERDILEAMLTMSKTQRKKTYKSF